MCVAGCEWSTTTTSSVVTSVRTATTRCCPSTWCFVSLSTEVEAGQPQPKHRRKHSPPVSFKRSGDHWNGEEGPAGPFWSSALVSLALSFSLSLFGLFPSNLFSILFLHPLSTTRPPLLCLETSLRHVSGVRSKNVNTGRWSWKISAGQVRLSSWHLTKTREEVWCWVGQLSC